jgi:Flp pilus assembly protein TadD
MSTSTKIVVVIALVAGWAVRDACARDHFTVKIPLRSRMSQTQRLNREGVEAVRKNQYEKAEALFLKAYLYDPTDPFTLNNLGYIAELQGQLDRAERFYKLASEQGCSAEIAMSSAKDLNGKPMTTAFENLQNIPMRVNRMNVDAVRLLSQGRGFEAVALLEQARSLDPQNPFTLNNLGVADEAVGDYGAAMRNYQEVADLHSSEPVVVTEDRSWRGASVSKMAEQSAKRLQKTIDGMRQDEQQAAMYDIRGVYEENRNQLAAARSDFLRAYNLDPSSAFSLNNRGFIAERDGDLESAQFFYEKAGQANDAGARVGLATQSSAEGQSLFSVARQTTGKVDRALAQYSQQRRRENGPIELTPRNNLPEGGSSEAPLSNPSPNAPSSAPTNPAPRPPQTPH